MSQDDGGNDKKSGTDKPLQGRLQTLQEMGRDYAAQGAQSGGGQTGGDRFGEALTDGTKPQQIPGGGPAGPSQLKGLDEMTRNVQFAEALVGERRDLDAGTKARLEGMLGQKLGNINVYVGKWSTAAAKSMNAEAFAVGKHLFFSKEKFSTTSAEGMALMAHEMTHAFQEKGRSTESKEAEAHAMEDKVVQGIRDGADMEIAQDQTSASGLLERLSKDETAVPPPSGGKPPDQDTEPASTHDSPDEKDVEQVLLHRVLELFRHESDVDFERHGFGM
jgi:hypothetical protein